MARLSVTSWWSTGAGEQGKRSQAGALIKAQGTLGPPGEGAQPAQEALSVLGGGDA